MCGIVGFVSTKASSAPDSARLLDALEALRHRGPSGSGTFEAEGVRLGSTRLSIIDLDGGSQPMRNEDGSVVVVFNGEIWNYRSLRKELESRGHRFANRS